MHVWVENNVYGDEAGKTCRSRSLKTIRTKSFYFNFVGKLGSVKAFNMETTWLNLFSKDYSVGSVVPRETLSNKSPQNIVTWQINSGLLSLMVSVVQELKNILTLVLTPGPHVVAVRLVLNSSEGSTGAIRYLFKVTLSHDWSVLSDYWPEALIFM